jgi:hypothetical protein
MSILMLLKITATTLIVIVILSWTYLSFSPMLRIYKSTLDNILELILILTALFTISILVFCIIGIIFDY